MKKVLTVLLCAVMLSFVAGVGMAAEEQVIEGTVEQSEAGVVIVGEQGEYIVVGQDLSEMVGKQVMVTGTVTETEQGKAINVMKIEEIE